MFRAYAVVVRLAYLSAVAVGLYFGGWALANPAGWIWNYSLGELIFAGLFIASVACAVRAATRPFRRLAFIPEAHLRERPVVGTLVTLAAVFASFLGFNIVLAFLQTWPETGDVNFGGPALLALTLYTIALLIGELVLVGRA